MGRDALALMKPSALLVNVGRGELVDETALGEALTERRLGGAGLDVFASEPLTEQSPLWKCPRTIITPHLGGHGGDGDARMVRLVHENAARLKRGEPLINVVRIP
jgi:phosphoglycerate dehydrogenase-like enzyme